MPDIPTSTLASAAKAAGALLRFRPWAVARRNDRLVLEEWEDLITWARDDLQKEAEELDAVTNDLAARGALRSGEFGHQLRRVRDEFARRWRDRKRASDRKVAELRESETAPVKGWRKPRRRPWPANPWAEELRTITAAWEHEERRREAVRREVEARG